MSVREWINQDQNQYAQYFYHRDNGLWHGVVHIHLGPDNDTAQHAHNCKKSQTKKILKHYVLIRTVVAGVPRKKKKKKQKSGGCKLYVGNINYRTNEADLRHSFGRYGTINNVFLPCDSYERPSGFAHVTFKSARDATTAINECNGSELDGRTISVRLSPDRKSVV